MKPQLITLASCLLIACGSPNLCDRDALQDALDMASPGDTVDFPGSCQIEGGVRVPADVALAGGEGSVLVSEDARAIGVELGAGAALRGVQVISSGRAAIVARDGARIASTGVELRHGLGVYGRGEVTLDQVTIEGPVVDGSNPRWLNVRAEPQEPAACEDCECAPGDVDADGDRVCEDGSWVTWAPTIGIYLRDAGATLTDVEVRGIARYGVVADNTELSWDRGVVSDVVGVGLMLRGGSSDLADVTVREVVAGLRAVPSYSVIATDGHDQTSARLTLRDGERYGLLSLESTGRHDGLQVSGHGDAAVWVGASTAFSIRGESVLEGNRLAGLVAVDSAGLELDGLVVRDVQTVRRSVGTFGVLEIGDGIQLTGIADATLRDVDISACERAGLLVDVTPGLRFEGVSVDSSGDAFGALGGEAADADPRIDVTMPPGWDAGIIRGGAAIANDAGATGAFDALTLARPDGATELVAVVGPMY